METFDTRNYEQSIDHIYSIMNLLVHKNHVNGWGHMEYENVLKAAIEIWKHQNPWIQRQYGTEPF